MNPTTSIIRLPCDTLTQLKHDRKILSRSKTTVNVSANSSIPFYSEKTRRRFLARRVLSEDICEEGMLLLVQSVFRRPGSDLLFRVFVTKYHRR